MNKFFTIFFLIIISYPLLAQNNWNWNLVWSLEDKPFLQYKAESEIAIVKAGFDTDEDGWGEFLCAWTDTERNFVLMYEATADNTYELVWYWEYPIPTNTFTGIAVGDLDNNGKVDIVITLPAVVSGDNPNPPRFFFFEWSGVVGENKYGKGELGSITPHKTWNFKLDDNIDFRPYGLTIEDIDKDGKNELICGVRSGDRGREIFVISATGALSGFGDIKIEFNHQEFFEGSLYSTTTGDLDGDGNREIYALVWADFTLRIFECMGDSQYDLVTSLDSVTAGTDYGALDGVRVADVNNDGVNELYIAGTEPTNTLFIITGISDVSQITKDDINPFYQIPIKAGGKLRSMYIADPDHDGNLSLMIAGETNGQIYDLEYKGSGDPADSSSWELNVIFDIWEFSGFAPTDSPTLSPRLFYGSPAGDMDNDGKDEYLFVNYSADFSVWEGDRYLWMVEIDKVTGIETINDIVPNQIQLMQNYPNPFNPNTNIEFSLPENGFVSIKVYDVLGKEIQTLVNDQINAGNHKVNFNASGLSSGIYYYTLSFFNQNNTQSFTDTKKLVLQK